MNTIIKHLQALSEQELYSNIVKVVSIILNTSKKLLQ